MHEDLRLQRLLATYREPRFDQDRLAALGDRLEAAFRRQAPRAWWRRPLVWAAAACLALAVPAAAWAMRPIPVPEATITTAVTISGTAGSISRHVMPVGVPMTIDGGSAALTWEDGTRLDLDNGVEITLVDGGDGARRVRLGRGRLSAEIAPQPEGRPLRIATPHTEITVRGTAFTVETDERGSQVSVSRGSVALRSPDAPLPVVVAAGEIAIAPPHGAPTARPQSARPLRNPGFEQLMTTDMHTGWCMDVRNNDSRARLVQDIRRGGRQSLLLEQFTPIRWPPGLADLPDYRAFLEAPQGGRGHVSVSQRFAVQAGQAYRIAFAWRAHGLSPERREPGPERGYVKFAACLFWHRTDGERTQPSQEVLTAYADAPEWTAWPPPEHLDLGRRIAPADATEGVISFKLSTAVAGRTVQVWLDDVEFVGE